MAGDPSFIDTNVLVYSLDRADPLKHERAHELLGSPPAGGYVISAQVLGEFFNVVTRRLGMSASEAREGVRRFAPLSATSVDDELVFDAIGICTEQPISYWDALIVSAAARLRCGILLSEDLNDGEVIAGVRVVDPFRTA